MQDKKVAGPGVISKAMPWPSRFSRVILENSWSSKVWMLESQEGVFCSVLWWVKKRKCHKAAGCLSWPWRKELRPQHTQEETQVSEEVWQSISLTGWRSCSSPVSDTTALPSHIQHYCSSISTKNPHFSFPPKTTLFFGLVHMLSQSLVSLPLTSDSFA